MMKKFLGCLLVLSLCFSLCACGGDTARYEELLTEIESKILSADLDGAYDLCEEALALKLNDEQKENIENQKALISFEQLVVEIEGKISSADLEEAYNLCKEALGSELDAKQREKIENQKAVILEVAFPGTFVARPEYVIDIEPKKAEGIFFSVRSLTDENEYDEVACVYRFEKETERDLAFERYTQKYLDQKYNFLDVKFGSTLDYTAYVYADDAGNSLTIQTSDDDADLILLLDKDLYDTDRIDMRLRSASLFDKAILIEE